MKFVLAGAARRVLGGSDDHPPCPYSRTKPIRCKGRLSELLDEDGRHRQHHSGYMPDMRNYQKPGSLRPDTDRDEVPKIEAQCSWCLATFWGKSLKTISDMFKGRPGFLEQDYQQWCRTRETKVMERFPKIFSEAQIREAKEKGRR